MEVITKKNEQAKVSAGWINLIAFIIPVHWMSFIIAGFETKNTKWILFGIFYAAPLFLLFLSFLSGSTNSAMFGFLSFSIFISWIITFIHSFLIRDDYKKLIIKKRNISKSNNYDWLINNKKDKLVNSLSINHQKIINEMLKEQKEINGKYNKINPIHQANFIDIIVMVEDFIDQTKELMKKEEELDKIIKGFNISEINLKIKEITDKMQKAERKELREEYENTLNNYKQRKQTYSEFADKKEIINLKLESYLVKIKEIKYEFIEVDFLISEEKKNNIFKKTDEIAEDINMQIDILSDTYKNIERKY
ncbi:MAG: hypothetical protein JXR51_10145 [Bacteroidales bacterium]|nr:hypothetical protein [Bacteroidales bacterium]MBN2757526.1 hypothetical protein [Bacteroidales bacterium]